MASLGGAGDLDLPDWNVALADEDFDCSPVKQPLAQLTLKDGNTQRVSAMGRTGVAGLAAAAVLKPAVALPAPAARPDLSRSTSENENAGPPAAAALAAEAEPPSSVRRTHTPSRTGLTSKAVRLPSRLGLTPGAKQAEPFAVPPSTRAATKATGPPPVAGGGGNLKSILKRLNFSTSKTRAAASAATSAAAAAQLPVSDRPSTSAAPSQAQSTIKQLSFDFGTTPVASTSAKPGHTARHVTFDATTVSPAPRSRPAIAAAALRTPEPTIQEEGSDDMAGGGSVNSAGAGHTPYDRRLSSLFRKYQEAGTPELTEAELDELVADGAVRSPSWKRLSSASVPESIRELSKKYDEASAGGAMMSPALVGCSPAAATPAPAASHEGMDADAGTPVAAAAAAEGSPAMDPTPHHVLDSVMKRNALYESPPADTAAAAAGSTEQRAAPPAATQAGQADAAQAAGVPLSPASAVAQLLAPVLVATIKEVEQDKQRAALQGQDLTAASPGSSPAEFYGFPRLDAEAGTPATSQRTSPVDGVPRDSEGIPTVTPATVTVHRGSYSGGLGLVWEEDDDLAAKLFPSFSPADSSDGFRFSPAEPAAGSAEQVAQEPGQQAEAASPEFSFFPTAGGPSKPQSLGATANTTPEVPGMSAAPVGSYISPEILGFYESQAQQQAGAGAGGSQGVGSKLPRSIIKSGQPLTEAGTPVLGHAQRGGGADVAPPTSTRELQALMADLRLEDPAGIEQMGTVSALSPVSARGGRMRGFLGGLARAITPVRRSARKLAAAPQRPLEAMLEEAEYAYVPNAALMVGEASPTAEAGADASPCSSAAPQEPSLAGMATPPGDQPEVSSMAASRRYGTRSAVKAAAAAAGAAATPAADVEAVESRRLSLRRLRTPLQSAHTSAGEAGSPPAGLTAADTPVAQDASPHLRESPGFGTPLAGAATTVASDGRAYSLRASTLKKTRKSTATPAAAASGKKEQQSASQAPQLSPTEQGIRASLRRSARKSRGPK